ncbi:glycosyltransferase family 2 protein [Dysgonomonas termitidis]|uniref:Glycosyltransferase family 2 protein n=1 Tax=Dysgonomonas termitidis TaxID=1516126 RepID=A0ABV9KSR7_9BACT
MVSIILPNYNHAPFLKQRIDSILNQTFQDFELIILDDCSTDNSRDIIEVYRKNPHISHIIYNETNSGSPFKQWRKGIDLAKGEYIWIAESDDWCESTLVETLIPPLDADEQITFGFVQSYYIVENEIKWISKEDYLENSVEGRMFIKSHLLYRNAVFNASMAIFKKKYFDAINNHIYTNYKFCGDWLFWGLMAAQGKVFISGKILNFFRKHVADVSGGAYSSGLNYLEEFDVLQSFYENGYIEKSELKNALHAKYDNFTLKRVNLPSDKIAEIDQKFSNYIDIRHVKNNKFVCLKIKNVLYSCKNKIIRAFR